MRTCGKLIIDLENPNLTVGDCGIEIFLDNIDSIKILKNVDS